MPKFNEVENQFWTQFMLDGNDNRPRMCQIYHTLVQYKDILRHSIIVDDKHINKNMYEIWSPVPIDTVTRLILSG